MNGDNSTQNSQPQRQPLYPSLSSLTSMATAAVPLDQSPPPSYDGGGNSAQKSQPQPQLQHPSSSSPPPMATAAVPLHQSPPPSYDDGGNSTQNSQPQPHHPSSSSPPPMATAAVPLHQTPPPSYYDSVEKWGTHIMGTPAVPTSHPDNQKAALWSAGDHQQSNNQHPYLQNTPIEKQSGSPMESILHVFSSWNTKAETMASNIWQNLNTGSSVSGAALGKVNLTAKAISGGGFESLYKQTFTTYPGEKLKKTFACYLSTTTGPVAGTLYLSNVHVAYCSDHPLSFPAPSGQQNWSYYKVLVPMDKISTINPVIMRENPKEEYIQIVTIDGHDLWCMGFVNYEKASRHLLESLSNFVVPAVAGQPVTA